MKRIELISDGPFRRLGSIPDDEELRGQRFWFLTMAPKRYPDGSPGRTMDQLRALTGFMGHVKDMP